MAKQQVIEAHEAQIAAYSAMRAANQASIDAVGARNAAEKVAQELKWK